MVQLIGVRSPTVKIKVVSESSTLTLSAGTPIPSGMSVSDPVVGGLVHYTATLMEPSGSPIANATVDFYDNGNYYNSAVTDSNGQATVFYVFGDTSTHSITAQFGSIASNTITVTATQLGPGTNQTGYGSVSFQPFAYQMAFEQSTPVYVLIVDASTNVPVAAVPNYGTGTGWAFTGYVPAGNYYWVVNLPLGFVVNVNTVTNLPPYAEFIGAYSMQGQTFTVTSGRNTEQHFSDPVQAPTQLYVFPYLAPTPSGPAPTTNTPYWMGNRSNPGAVYAADEVTGGFINSSPIVFGQGTSTQWSPYETNKLLYLNGVLYGKDWNNVLYAVDAVTLNPLRYTSPLGKVTQTNGYVAQTIRGWPFQGNGHSDLQTDGTYLYMPTLGQPGILKIDPSTLLIVDANPNPSLSGYTFNNNYGEVRICVTGSEVFVEASTTSTSPTSPGTSGILVYDSSTLTPERFIPAPPSYHLLYMPTVSPDGSTLYGQSYQVISATLSAPLTSGTTYTSLSITPLTGPAQTPGSEGLKAGDVVLIASGSNTQKVTLTADAPLGSTTLVVQGFTANYSYPAGSTVSMSIQGIVAIDLATGGVKGFAETSGYGGGECTSIKINKSGTYLYVTYYSMAGTSNPVTFEWHGYQVAYRGVHAFIQIDTSTMSVSGTYVAPQFGSEFSYVGYDGNNDVLFVSYLGGYLAYYGLITDVVNEPSLTLKSRFIGNWTYGLVQNPAYGPVPASYPDSQSGLIACSGYNQLGQGSSTQNSF